MWLIRFAIVLVAALITAEVMFRLMHPYPQWVREMFAYLVAVTTGLSFSRWIAGSDQDPFD